MSKQEKQPREYRGVRDEIKEQQLKTKDMPLKDKLKYFWGYYKIHAFVIIIALVLVITLIHDIATVKDYSFYALMLNSPQLSSESIAASFTEYADLDTEKHECIIDTSFSLSMQTYSQYDLATSQKLIALVQANDLDTVIMAPDTFYNYGLSEMFADLRTVFTDDELSRYSDCLYYIDYAEVEAANEDSDYEEEYDSSLDSITYTEESILAEAETHRHPENMTEPVPIGIFMDDSPFVLETNAYSQSVPIFGLVSTSKRTDTGKKYLEFLWDENVDFSQMILTELY